MRMLSERTWTNALRLVSVHVDGARNRPDNRENTVDQTRIAFDESVGWKTRLANQRLDVYIFFPV